jgi:hypothetical protein
MEDERYSVFILLAVLVGVSAYVLAYGLQTLLYFEARHWASSVPELAVTPQTLTIPPAAAASGARSGKAGAKEAMKAGSAKTSHLEFFNYECEAPWAGPAKIVNGSDFIDMKFPAGVTLRVYAPEAQVNDLQSLQGEDAVEQQRMAAVFGPHPFESNYDLYDAVYSAEPGKASAFMPRIEAEKLNSLLLWKLAFDTAMPGGIYRFESGRLRGLQFGDPEKTQSVLLRMFNERDRHFEVMITMAASASSRLTQGEIDQVIASFQPIPLPGE